MKADQFAFLETVLTCGWVADFSTAVDGGANVGTWAIRMSEQFKYVVAFEPAPEIYQQLLYATAEHVNIERRREALLDHPCQVEIVKPEKKKALRSLYVRRSKEGRIYAMPLDEFGLTSCGLIKLDVEGAEYPALRGAKRVIAKFRPTLMVEMDRFGDRFGHTLQETEQLIASMGYVEVGRSRPDRCYLPIERIVP